MPIGKSNVFFKNYFMRIPVNCFLVVIMAINLFSCSIAQKKERLAIEWRPGYNAPKYYPVEVISGAFWGEGNKAIKNARAAYIVIG